MVGTGWCLVKIIGGSEWLRQALVCEACSLLVHGKQ
jgi:hypothetical protein